MFKKNKDERKKAKMQDKKFVEFRKEEILRNVKPSNRGFDYSKFDEVRLCLSLYSIVMVCRNSLPANESCSTPQTWPSALSSLATCP